MDDMALQYNAWVKSSPFDIGYTTRKALMGRNKKTVDGII